MLTVTRQAEGSPLCCVMMCLHGGKMVHTASLREAGSLLKSHLNILLNPSTELFISFLISNSSFNNVTPFLLKFT